MCAGYAQTAVARMVERVAPGGAATTGTDVVQRYRPRHPFLAGGITGAIEICITYPLEYAKCQLQLAQPAAHRRPASDPLNAGAGGSLRGVFRETVRSRGVAGLYSGLPPWLLFSLPRAALRFSIYEEVLARHDASSARTGATQGGKAPAHVAMLAGVLAGVVEATTCMTPMHCIQIKTQQRALGSLPPFRGLLDAITGIVREEGVVRGLYAGLGPTVLKQAVNSCIRFATMNELTRLLSESRGGAAGSGAAPLPVHETFLLGACAGALSSVVSHPIDTVKSNMQGNRMHSDRCAHARRPAHMHTRTHTIHTHTHTHTHTPMVPLVHRHALLSLASISSTIASCS